MVQWRDIPIFQYFLSQYSDISEVRKIEIVWYSNIPIFQYSVMSEYWNIPIFLFIPEYSHNAISDFRNSGISQYLDGQMTYYSNIPNEYSDIPIFQYSFRNIGITDFSNIPTFRKSEKSEFGNIRIFQYSYIPNFWRKYNI